MVITYQHAAYISQTLDGALAMKTDFPFEVVVADDGSTDGTQAIVASYRDRHPGVVRALLPEKNQGYDANLRAAVSACRGEYIACIDGDDFFCDDTKLAVQAAHLDAHPDVVMTGHRAKIVNEAGLPTGELMGPDHVVDQPPMAAVEASVSPSLSMMFRASALRPADLPPAFWQLMPADDAWRINFAHHGSFHHDPRIMAAYRVHGRSLWNSRPAVERALHRLRFYERVPAFADAKFHPVFRRKLAEARAMVAYEYAAGGRRAESVKLLLAAAPHLGSGRRGVFAKAVARTLAPGVYDRLRSLAGVTA